MLNVPTKCPYCEGQQIVDSHYKYRFIDVDGPLYNSEKLRVVEIYCAVCHRTISVTPIKK